MLSDDHPPSPVRSQGVGEAASVGPSINHFQLNNGLEVVVIPDHRAPVVTHMIWYRNGSADDPLGQSGIAHFLEHLMFKGTQKHPPGEFSNVVAELGGQENAFTSNDYTAYFQRLPKEHLAVAMEFEADRMTGLSLNDDVVNPERDVVLEERRMRVDTDPAAELGEALQAALFVHHPYGIPVIGWSHEIETLSRADALAYYHRFYTPKNAILVVAGDVSEAMVRELAEASYGKIAAAGEAPKRRRPQEPQLKGHRLVTLADEKVEQPSHQRLYLAPSCMTAQPGESEALEVLAHLLGGGQTSRLYRSLVIDQQIAVSAGAYYMGTALDETRFYIYALPAPGISLPELDAAIDEIIEKCRREPVSDEDLIRAKTRLVAEAIYAQDSQAVLARWYGAALAIGLSIEAVRAWPDRIEAVTAAGVQQAAARWLLKNRAVTGFLLSKRSAEAA
jgi:zinc protease